MTDLLSHLSERHTTDFSIELRKQCHCESIGDESRWITSLLLRYLHTTEQYLHTDGRQGHHKRNSAWKWYTGSKHLFSSSSLRRTKLALRHSELVQPASITFRYILIAVSQKCFSERSTMSLFSRFNQRKNDTVLIQFGPLCNYQTNQTNADFGRIRLGKDFSVRSARYETASHVSSGVYVRIEPTLGDGQTSYVNLDVFYSPSNLWIGQILFTGKDPVVPSVVVVSYRRCYFVIVYRRGLFDSFQGTPLLFPLNSTTQAFNQNTLTIAQYGLKIPPTSHGGYSALTSTGKWLSAGVSSSSHRSIV